VEFTPDVPTDVALQRVRDRVDLARGELPEDVLEPVIKEINLAEFPIMQVSISGDLSPMQLKEIADKLQDEIETLPGVLKVDVLGALEPEIRMEFDRDRMALYNLVITDIMQLIPTENVNISAAAGNGSASSMSAFRRFRLARGRGPPAVTCDGNPSTWRTSPRCAMLSKIAPPTPATTAATTSL
jgi:multidrug efflux pump subunit AcrB